MKKYLCLGTLVALFFILAVYNTTSNAELIETMQLGNRTKNITFIESKGNKFIYFELTGNLKLYSKDKVFGLEKLLYQSEENILLTQSKKMNDDIVFLELFENEEKGFNFNVYLFSDGKIKLLYKGTSYTVPCISVGDEHVQISYEWGGTSKLKSIYCGDKKESITLDDGSTQRKSNTATILKTSYTENDSGNIRGEKIIYSGGASNTIWAQIIKCNNEPLESSTSIKIAKADTNGNNNSKVYEIQHKSIFIYGNDDYLICSAYSSEEPLRESGLIYKVNGEKLELVKRLSKIESGNDIIDAKFINDHEVLILSPKIGYICNLKTGEEKTYNFEDGDKATISGTSFQIWNIKNDKITIKNV